jgi:hypothetical protein
MSLRGVFQYTLANVAQRSVFIINFNLMKISPFPKTMRWSGSPRHFQNHETQGGSPEKLKTQLCLCFLHCTHVLLHPTRQPPNASA